MTENLKTVNFQDLELVGVDCGDTFTWIRGERYYYAAKGLSEPKRYEACRLKRKLTLVPEEVRLTGVSPKVGRASGSFAFIVRITSSSTCWETTILSLPSMKRSSIIAGAPFDEYIPEKMTLLSRKTRGLGSGTIAPPGYFLPRLAACFLQPLFSNSRTLESLPDLLQCFQRSFLPGPDNQSVTLQVKLQHIAKKCP